MTIFFKSCSFSSNKGNTSKSCIIVTVMNWLTALLPAFFYENIFFIFSYVVIIFLFLLAVGISSGVFELRNVGRIMYHSVTFDEKIPNL